MTKSDAVELLARRLERVAEWNPAVAYDIYQAVLELTNVKEAS